MPKRKKVNAFNLGIEIILSIIALIFLYPYFDLIITSFKDESRIFDPFYFPIPFHFENYQKLFSKVNMLQVYANTIAICFGTIIIMVLVSSAAGYVISRAKEKFFKSFFYYFMFGMIIPSQASMIILYKLGVVVHLMNTRTFLTMIYVAGSSAYAIMLYVGFTKNIPHELEEAASIDGYGVYRTFFKIIFPLLLPATGTLFVTTIFWFWNDFSGPLIYLNDGTKQTLMFAIFTFKIDQRSTVWGPIFAMCTLAVVPLAIFFLFTQKFLIKGMIAGAVKG